MDKQKDPVCGMQIEVEDAAGQSDYEGRTKQVVVAERSAFTMLARHSLA